MPQLTIRQRAVRRAARRQPARKVSAQIIPIEPYLPSQAAIPETPSEPPAPPAAPPPPVPTPPAAPPAAPPVPPEAGGPMERGPAPRAVRQETPGRIGIWKSPGVLWDGDPGTVAIAPGPLEVGAPRAGAAGLNDAVPRSIIDALSPDGAVGAFLPLAGGTLKSAVFLDPLLTLDADSGYAQIAFTAGTPKHTFYVGATPAGHFRIYDATNNLNVVSIWGGNPGEPESGTVYINTGHLEVAAANAVHPQVNINVGTSTNPTAALIRTTAKTPTGTGSWQFGCGATGSFVIADMDYTTHGTEAIRFAITPNNAIDFWVADASHILINGTPLTDIFVQRDRT